MQFKESSVPQNPVALEEGASVPIGTDGAAVGASVGKGTGGAVTAAVVGAGVATVGAGVAGRTGGKVCTNADGAGVTKDVGGDVDASIINMISAKLSHVVFMTGMVALIVALAMYSDSKHRLANSVITP